ncbi:hypothetical protein DFH06DRAFT_1405847 [Mycena polygramma]|nr:hypothetical protein DFH06DRAFT_1405847 [Mycena polygramma]
MKQYGYYVSGDDADEDLPQSLRGPGFSSRSIWAAYADSYDDSEPRTFALAGATELDCGLSPACNIGQKRYLKSRAWCMRWESSGAKTRGACVFSTHVHVMPRSSLSAPVASPTPAPAPAPAAGYSLARPVMAHFDAVLHIYGSFYGGVLKNGSGTPILRPFSPLGTNTNTRMRRRHEVKPKGELFGRFTAGASVLPPSFFLSAVLALSAVLHAGVCGLGCAAHEGAMLGCQRSVRRSLVYAYAKLASARRVTLWLLAWDALFCHLEYASLRRGIPGLVDDSSSDRHPALARSGQHLGRIGVHHIYFSLFVGFALAVEAEQGSTGVGVRSVRAPKVNLKERACGTAIAVVGESNAERRRRKCGRARAGCVHLKGERMHTPAPARRGDGRALREWHEPDTGCGLLAAKAESAGGGDGAGARAAEARGMRLRCWWGECHEPKAGRDHGRVYAPAFRERWWGAPPDWRGSNAGRGQADMPCEGDCTEVKMPSCAAPSCKPGESSSGRGDTLRRRNQTMYRETWCIARGGDTKVEPVECGARTTAMGSACDSAAIACIASAERLVRAGRGHAMRGRGGYVCVAASIADCQDVRKWACVCRSAYTEVNAHRPVLAMIRAIVVCDLWRGGGVRANAGRVGSKGGRSVKHTTPTHDGFDTDASGARAPAEPEQGKWRANYLRVRGRGDGYTGTCARKSGMWYTYGSLVSARGMGADPHRARGWWCSRGVRHCARLVRRQRRTCPFLGLWGVCGNDKRGQFLFRKSRGSPGSPLSFCGTQFTEATGAGSRKCLEKRSDMAPGVTASRLLLEFFPHNVRAAHVRGRADGLFV